MILDSFTAISIAIALVCIAGFFVVGYHRKEWKFFSKLMLLTFALCELGLVSIDLYLNDQPEVVIVIVLSVLTLSALIMQQSNSKGRGIS